MSLLIILLVIVIIVVIMYLYLVQTSDNDKKGYSGGNTFELTEKFLRSFVSINKPNIEMFDNLMNTKDIVNYILATVPEELRATNKCQEIELHTAWNILNCLRHNAILQNVSDDIVLLILLGQALIYEISTNNELDNKKDLKDILTYDPDTKIINFKGKYIPNKINNLNIINPLINNIPVRMLSVKTVMRNRSTLNREMLNNEMNIQGGTSLTLNVTLGNVTKPILFDIIGNAPNEFGNDIITSFGNIENYYRNFDPSKIMFNDLMYILSNIGVASYDIGVENCEYCPVKLRGFTEEEMNLRSSGIGVTGGSLEIFAGNQVVGLKK